MEQGQKYSNILRETPRKWGGGWLEARKDTFSYFPREKVIWVRPKFQRVHKSQFSGVKSRPTESERWGGGVLSIIVNGDKSSEKWGIYIRTLLSLLSIPIEV